MFINSVEYNVQRAINTISRSVDISILDSSNKIASSARNIDRWRANMYQALENIRNEIDLLYFYLKKLQRSRIALNVICSITTECLERRSYRLDMDLTLDPAQVELINESKLVNEVGELINCTVSQINEQLKLNGDIKQQLEENWSNKNHSFEIDAKNLGLNIHSADIMTHKNVMKDSESTCLTIPEWETATQTLYEKAQQVLNDSEKLRTLVDDHVLKKSAKRLRDQADAVDIALARFIANTQKVSQAMENDLKQVVQRLGDSEKLLGDLRRVIANLENAKMTAETRLYNRLKRPGDENCNDAAQSRLLSEINSLQEQLATLNYQLQCARTGHTGLLEARLKLEDEVRVKRKTLWIDSFRCQKVRARYPSINILIGR
ncbi:tektin-4 isoform X2 [Daktulosphaira vitifoliae]|uniref:tektin-4 isoform X2 n=1 Tax=Daktulosphaira vitifoliae TaxID=58002 RepID=UPI0021A9BC50|nr:tektin-4 isoform X2 [Daktulosphaira vitifoliae]